MFFSADLANLILYCAQQLGVTLGVGAETIMLAAYLISMSDGVVDEKETQYARAIQRVMNAALGLIILSGVGITVLHVTSGQSATIFTPAFLFKWLLIVLATGLTLLRYKFSTNSIVEGFIGGIWYALFVVHILAPATGWANLFILFAVWTLGFVLCWEVLVHMWQDTKEIVKKAPPAPKKEEVKIVAPVPLPPPPPPPAPPAPLQQVTKPAIVLAADLPKATPVPQPPKPAPAPPPIPVPARVQPPPVVAPAPKVEKITLAQASPFDTVAPSPSVKVTDTPFLPAVPALQPIPIPLGQMPAPSPQVPLPPSLKTPLPQGVPAPITTMPGGTSTPASSVELVQEGLSAMNVMPKAPPDAKK